MPSVLYVRRSIRGAVFLQVLASWPGVAVYCASCGRDVVPLATFDSVPSVGEVKDALRLRLGGTRAPQRAARLLVARGVAREVWTGSYGGTA